MPCKHTDLGTIQIWECSRGQQPDEPRCSVKVGDVRCEQPGRHRCAHPIKPRKRSQRSLVPRNRADLFAGRDTVPMQVNRLQTQCERLLCDEHKAERDGMVVCPFHGGAR